MTHYLYRFFDDAGRLLYVGESIDPLSRASSHRQTAPWFWRVAALHIIVLDSRDDALRAEAAAIKSELPMFNRKLAADDRSLAFVAEQSAADEHVLAKRSKPIIPLPTYDDMRMSTDPSMAERNRLLAEQLVRMRALEWVTQVREGIWQQLSDAEAAWAHTEEPITSKHYSRRWLLIRERVADAFWKKPA